MSFLRFSRKTVFVSCSRDMASAVEVVRAAVDDLNRRLPWGDGWDVYHWARSDTVWTAATWQAQIYRPSDPNCHLVICLLGERTGEPLPTAFPLPPDLTLPSWIAAPGADDTAKVALTGTLFELLDATFGPQHPGVARATLCYVQADARTFADPHRDARERSYGFE